MSVSSLQKGIEFFVQNFSGLSELTKRNDAGAKLLERYQHPEQHQVEYAGYF